MSLQTIRTQHGYRLVQNGSGQRTVVQVVGDQVRSVMPATTGGLWTAPDTTLGVHYVASFYSASYANRVFRQRVAQADDISDWRSYLPAQGQAA